MFGELFFRPYIMQAKVPQQVLSGPRPFSWKGPNKNHPNMLSRTIDTLDTCTTFMQKYTKDKKKSLLHCVQYSVCLSSLHSFADFSAVHDRKVLILGGKPSVTFQSGLLNSRACALSLC